jgi:hypothetical protein
MRQLPLPGFLSRYPNLGEQGWYHWYPYASSWIGVSTIVDASNIKTKQRHLIVIPLVLESREYA